MKAVLLILIALMLTICGPADASDRLGKQRNFLIIGEDATSDAVPHGGSTFKRVLAALINQFREDGFNVYGEEVVSIAADAQARDHHTDAEAIEIAGSVKRISIDIIVMISISAQWHEPSHLHVLDHGPMTDIHFEARIIDVPGKKRLESLKSEWDWFSLKVSPVCNHACRLSAIDRNSDRLAQSLFMSLKRKLI